MNGNTKPTSLVYNVNCLEYMRSLPDKHFDLCIADPPFGINIHKSGRLKMSLHDIRDKKYHEGRYETAYNTIFKALLEKETFVEFEI